MPINSLVKCLFNFWTVMFQKTIHGQFVKNSWTFMFQKDDLSSFVLCLFLSFPLFSSLFLFPPLSSSLPPLLSSLFLSFPLSSSLFLSFPPLLSFFNVRPAHVANFLKTRNLRKRHFRLKILSQGKPLRIKTLDAKFAQWSAHLPADPTLHTPPETDPTYSAAKPYTM